MPNTVIVLVVCGLWVVGVCGGAVLERFTARLAHKIPRYRMGPGLLEYHPGKVSGQREEGNLYHYNAEHETSVNSRLVNYRLEEKSTSRNEPKDRLVQYRIANERKPVGENDKTILAYKNIESDDLPDVTEHFENEGLFEPRVRKESNFRTTEYPSTRWTVQQASVQVQSACVPVAVDDETTVRAAVILPNTSDFTTSLSTVLPVLRLAQLEVQRRQLLPSTLAFQWLPRDDRCDAVHAQIGTFEAVKQNVHVFFGPACEYSVAPVARMIKFWHTPLLTTGALTFAFSRDKRDPDSEYHLLLRAGLLSFRDLALFIIALLRRYKWDKVMLVYEKDGCRQISGKHTCKLMMETLVEFFKREGLHYGSYDLEKNAADGLNLNLRRELGYQYNS